MQLLLKALDTAIWEMGEAFKGLPDEDVWRRAHPRLLSVGEIAAHVAYWESIAFMGEGFASPLVDSAARYYTSNVDELLTLGMTASEVYEEVKRVHGACKATFLELQPDAADPSPHRAEWTWGSLLEYQVFHFSYHTGQMYSVRHLMGHETVDN